MRIATLLSIALLVAASASPVMAETNRTTITQPTRVASSCGAELSSCLESHSQKGAYGESYVPPDDAAACHAAYRQCTGHR